MEKETAKRWKRGEEEMEKGGKEQKGDGGEMGKGVTVH